MLLAFCHCHDNSHLYCILFPALLTSYLLWTPIQHLCMLIISYPLTHCLLPFTHHVLQYPYSSPLLTLTYDPLRTSFPWSFTSPLIPHTQLWSLQNLKLILLFELTADCVSVSCFSTRLMPRTDSIKGWQIRYSAHVQVHTHTHTHIPHCTVGIQHIICRTVTYVTSCTFSLQDLSLLKTQVSKFPVFKPLLHIMKAFEHRIHNRTRKMLQHIAKAQAVAKEQGNSYCNDWAEQCKHLWTEEARLMDAASVDKFPLLP